MHKHTCEVIVISLLTCTNAALAADTSSPKDNNSSHAAANPRVVQKQKTTKSESTTKTKPATHSHKAATKGISEIALGKSLYKQYQCSDCHNLHGKGCDDGIVLDHVGSIRTKEFIREHLLDPDKHFDKNAHAFTTDLNLMPPQNLEPNELHAIVEYLHSLK